MIFLDVIFALILIITISRGFIRGFVRELTSIIGIILGFVLANNHYENLTQIMLQVVPDEYYAGILSYLAIFVGAFLLILLLGAIFREIMKIAALTWTDKVAGSILGFFKGGLLCSLIFLMLTFFSPESNLLKNSRTLSFFSMFTTTLAAFIPEEIEAKLQEKSKHLQELWGVKIELQDIPPEEQNE